MRTPRPFCEEQEWMTQLLQPLPVAQRELPVVRPGG